MLLFITFMLFLTESLGIDISVMVKSFGEINISRSLDVIFMGGAGDSGAAIVVVTAFPPSVVFSEDPAILIIINTIKTMEQKMMAATLKNLFNIV